MHPKTVLLIGYTGGIGYKTAEVLINAGYTVIGTYFKEDDKPDPVHQNFTKKYLDLKGLASLKNLQTELKDQPLYAIINCAGIAPLENDSAEDNLKVWDETIAINLTSNFYLATLFGKNLVQAGRFIMISSTDSYFGGAVTASYAASKAGVNSLTKSLALTLKDKKIHVNAIAPGWVNTPMIEGYDPKFYTRLAEINPLGRVADPNDIAQLIKFLLSPDSDYINGQIITADGGYTNQDPTLIIEEEMKQSSPK